MVHSLYGMECPGDSLKRASCLGWLSTLSLIARHGRRVGDSGHDASKSSQFPRAARSCTIKPSTRQRGGGAQSPGDERVHADVFALHLGEHGFVQIVGNGSAERGHGYADAQKLARWPDGDALREGRREIAKVACGDESRTRSFRKAQQGFGVKNRMQFRLASLRTGSSTN